MRAVDHDVNVDSGGQRGLQTRQLCAYGVDGLDHVGARLLGDDKQHALPPIAVPRADLDVLRRLDGTSDVLDVYRRAVAIGENEVVIGGSL